MPPGQWRPLESWEPSLYFWCVALAGMIVFQNVVVDKDRDTSTYVDITKWARDEAEARNRARAAGETIEYGKQYSATYGVRAPKYIKEGTGKMPQPEEA